MSGSTNLVIWDTPSCKPSLETVAWQHGSMAGQNVLISWTTPMSITNVCQTCLALGNEVTVTTHQKLGLIHPVPYSCTPSFAFTHTHTHAHTHTHNTHTRTHTRTHNTHTHTQHTHTHTNAPLFSPKVHYSPNHSSQRVPAEDSSVSLRGCRHSSAQTKRVQEAVLRHCTGRSSLHTHVLA